LSIPTQRDRDMAALGDIATNILQQLQTERASPNDLARMRAQLRSKLQEFADEVMATARRE
jgi:translation initiation factor 2B subunit (eIF-2B alpha/beta/delta family)